MQNNIKRIMAIFLCAIMAFSSMQSKNVIFSGFEELLDVKAEAAKSGKCGDNLTYTLSDSGTLTISGTGEMWMWGPYAPDSPEMPWQAEIDLIKKVDIAYGVTSIGMGAFTGCINLTDVNISESIISIGKSSFCGCEKIKKLVIPDSVKTIAMYAFASCSSLTDLTLSDNLDSIGKFAFCGCTSLKKFIIPDGITNIGESVFGSCSGLESIFIPKSVTGIIWYAFSGCDNLRDIYYAGSEGDWQSINIGHNNEPLTNARIHYNCSVSDYESTNNEMFSQFIQIIQNFIVYAINLIEKIFKLIMEMNLL